MCICLCTYQMCARPLPAAWTLRNFRLLLSAQKHRYLPRGSRLGLAMTGWAYPGAAGGLEMAARECFGAASALETAARACIGASTWSCSRVAGVSKWLHRPQLGSKTPRKLQCREISRKLEKTKENRGSSRNLEKARENQENLNKLESAEKTRIAAQTRENSRTSRRL